MANVADIKKAVNALKKHDTGTIYLQAGISQPLVDEKVLIPVLFSLAHAPSLAEVSLIFISRDPGIKYRTLLQDTKIFEEVIGVSKLAGRLRASGKTKPPFKYDIILYDRRIKNLPQILGKPYYKNGQSMPIPIKVDDKLDDSTLCKSIVKQAKTIANCTRMALVPSTCLSMAVGNAAMPTKELTENIKQVSDELRAKIGENSHVKSLHIKTPEGAALPIYKNDA